MQKIQWILIASIICISCNNSPKQQSVTHVKRTVLVKPDVKYNLIAGKDSIKKTILSFNPDQKKILCAINRVDSAHLFLLDTILLPNKLEGAVEQYLPFPGNIAALDSVHKIIFFSYPAQAFGAYENGDLVYTGQTNMGRKTDPTPTGLFFTNWKAEKTTSTFNDEWDLKWNFNIENKEGVGFHEYALPGYPASHSCLRLTEADAKYLYNWADQWILKGTDDVQAKGTPVVVFGSYPFGASKPWYQLTANGHALDITEQTLADLAAPYLQQIKTEEDKRENLEGK